MSGSKTKVKHEKIRRCRSIDSDGIEDFCSRQTFCFDGVLFVSLQSRSRMDQIVGHLIRSGLKLPGTKDDGWLLVPRTLPPSTSTTPVSDVWSSSDDPPPESQDVTYLTLYIIM